MAHGYPGQNLYMNSIYKTLLILAFFSVNLVIASEASDDDSERKISKRKRVSSDGDKYAHVEYVEEKTETPKNIDHKFFMAHEDEEASQESYKSSGMTGTSHQEWDLLRKKYFGAPSPRNSQLKKKKLSPTAKTKTNTNLTHSDSECSTRSGASRSSAKSTTSKKSNYSDYSLSQLQLNAPSNFQIDIESGNNTPAVNSTLSNENDSTKDSDDENAV